MESVHQVAGEGASQRILAEINATNNEHQVSPGHDETRNNEGRSEEDESRVNGPEIVQNGHAGPGDATQLPGPQGGAQKPGQQQQQLGSVQWDRFLPVKTLRVLLVENDNSTCQIVTALLRNCSYEVITAPDGLQAWRILQDQMNHIDLVLTEVVMPGLSGIGLLSKIMSHKTCKIVPVIMMSSNDSMGIVFKCLSKGAVDFLVKPIRKNELKILWQHVWRRCHSSSGSGSESGIQMQRCDRSNSDEDSDDNSGSSDDEENTSIRLIARDGSDTGSGTRNSWTKRAVEVDSPQPMSPSDQLADPSNSTCAQVIHPKAENYCDGWLPIAAQKECNDEFMGKDLEIGVPGNLNGMMPAKPADGSTDKTPDSGLKTEGATEGSNTSDEPTTKAADLITSITNSICAQQAAPRITNAPSGFIKTSDDGKDKGCDGFAELPSLELSLKRLRSAGDCGNPSVDDRNVLRRSDSSAFTRYHTSAVASNQAPTGGYGGSSSQLGNSSEACKTDLTHNMTSNSNRATLIKQGSNEGSNNNDMGSTTKNVFNCPAPAKEKVTSPLAVKSNQHTSAFHPVQLRTAAPSPAASPQTVQAKSKEVAPATTTSTKVVQGQTKEIYLEHHHHHHYHHIHHHHDHHGVQQHQPSLPPTDHGMTMGSSGVTGAPSQTMISVPVEGQAANYSMNASNSGSNHGSNGQNGGNTNAHAGGVNVESANIVAEKGEALNGNGNGSGSGSGSGVYQDRLAQREAALNKFRQKRKERNFNKKVRYQSRKRLAEQRPRVRGQFVRQSVNHDHPDRDAER